MNKQSYHNTVVYVWFQRMFFVRFKEHDILQGNISKDNYLPWKLTETEYETNLTTDPLLCKEASFKL